MNQQQYQNTLKQAESLEFKVRDYLDDKDHSLAGELLEETRRLVDELETKKNPRSLEGRVKSIMQTLQTIRDRGLEIMDHNHTDFLYREYERLMIGLRKFDNY